MSRLDSDSKTNAAKRRTRSLIGTTFVQIVEIYDDSSAAVHMVNILRSKGTVTGVDKNGNPKYRDPYFIRDEEMLKIMENYREELDMNALESLQTEIDNG